MQLRSVRVKVGSGSWFGWCGRSSEGVAQASPAGGFIEELATDQRWCDALDVQFRVTTGHSGLAHFLPVEGADQWSEANRIRWPRLVLATDLGSDALCGYQALERRYGLNVDLSPDPAHGLHNDIKLALGGCQLYGFWLTLIAAMNLPWGPDKDEYRYLQLRESTLALHQGKRPGEMPLFQNFCPRIRRSLADMGVELPGESSQEQEIFDFMKKRGFGVREGRRISMCRFMASVEGAAVNLPKWWVDAYESVAMSLELDLLKSKELKKLVLRIGASEAPGENAGSTSGTKVTMEDRAFRSAFDNAMVLRCAVYLDGDNKRLAEMVLSVVSPWKAWHGEMAKSLRSCEDARNWWMGQITGQFMGKLAATLAQMCSSLQLDKCGFVVRPDQAKKTAAEEVVVEDDLSDIFGQLSLNLWYHRMRRCLHIFAFPYRLLRCLGGADLATKTIQEFLHASNSWEAFEGLAEKSTIQKAVQKRSIFHKQSVKQLEVAVVRSDGVAGPALLEHLKHRASLLLGTLPVEEIIGSQKNSKLVKVGRQFRKPEYSMAAAIRAGVLDKRCRFQTTSLDTPLESKSARLDADCFAVNPLSRSLPFSEIATTKTSPDFFSPSAQNLNSQYADTVVLKVCR